MSEQNSYRRIIRSSSIFGMVQVAHILIAIIRSKALALLIGPAGYGIFGLLNSTIDLVRFSTGFGLETSSVKIISEAGNDKAALEHKAGIVVKLTVLTGLLGTLVTVIFSKYFSLLTFGDTGKTIAIMVIAVSILFQQVANGQIAVMQGMQYLVYLAKANLYGNLSGLLVTLPIYYFYGFDAIVPSIIIAAILNFFVSRYFYLKLGLKNSVTGTLRSTISNGRDMLYFGAMLSISGFLPILSNYIIQVFISHTSTLATVGLFTVGMALINSYVGILFTAMSAEYYPRLSAINKNLAEESKAVNQQSVIAMLAIIPIIVFFAGFSNFIIHLLFSEKFNTVVPMLIWAIVAMFFKAFSFSMGYVIITRGDSKVFLKTSVLFNAIYLLLLLGGFYFKGLEGVGMGLLIYYILHLIGVAIIINLRYGLKISDEVIKIFVSGLLICLATIVFNRTFSGTNGYLIFSVLLLISLGYSLYGINKRTSIRDIFGDLIKRIK